MERTLSCPYCGEPVSVWLDEGGGNSQSYVEDCAVCCRPWQVHVWRDADGELYARLTREND